MKFLPYKKIACLVAASALSTVAIAETPIIGLITKTNTNPFFVKMKDGAQQKADELGVELRTFAGRYDGDNETQVQAVENLIAAGAKGILITPSDTAGIVPTIQKARDAGLLVIALDTPLSPANAADMTFATDNFKAGEMIGQSLQRAEGAQPTAIGPPAPEQQRRRHREPQDEGQRVEQECLPAEIGGQRAEQRH